jgi:hypothetical protein
MPHGESGGLGRLVKVYANNRTQHEERTAPKSPGFCSRFTRQERYMSTTHVRPERFGPEPVGPPSLQRVRQHDGVRWCGLYRPRGDRSSTRWNVKARAWSPTVALIVDGVFPVSYIAPLIRVAKH